MIGISSRASHIDGMVVSCMRPLPSLNARVLKLLHGNILYTKQHVAVLMCHMRRGVILNQRRQLPDKAG